MFSFTKCLSGLTLFLWASALAFDDREYEPDSGLPCGFSEGPTQGYVDTRPTGYHYGYRVQFALRQTRAGACLRLKQLIGDSCSIPMVRGVDLVYPPTLRDGTCYFEIMFFHFHRNTPPAAEDAGPVCALRALTCPEEDLGITRPTQCVCGLADFSLLSFLCCCRSTTRWLIRGVG